MASALRFVLNWRASVSPNISKSSNLETMWKPYIERLSVVTSAASTPWLRIRW
jgi:hypothetical protein